jgi:hypothetical protein
MAPDRGRAPKPQDDLLDWFTVSYTTIYAAVGLVLLLVVGGGYFFFTRGASRATPPPDAPPPTVTTAHFMAIEGNVKVKGVGTFEWVTADKSMVLKKSDLVRTGSGATAEIAFFDGTVVHVRPDSLITIEETSEDPSTKRRKVAWHISTGEVNFQTTRHNVPGSSTEVSTPTVKTVAGDETKGGIRVAESGESDVKIYKGTGQLETKGGRKVDLKPNEGVTVDAAGNAGAKAALPEVPALQAPPHGTEVSYIDPMHATTLLLWKAVAGATSYHVMLDYSPYFNRPLVDRKGIKESSVELRGLDVGKYYWRVSAVDKNEAEGSFSEFSRFTVTRPTAAQGDGPPPPLIIETLDVRQNILQVKGRTEPGATVTVNGQRVDVQGDGSFNEFITLDKPGRQVVTVRAVGINGGANEQRRPVVVAAF